MRIYFKNNPVKFHSDPIWNDGVLGFFEECRVSTQQEKEQEQE